MEDEAISWERHAQEYEAPVSGVVVRVALKVGASVREVFTWVAGLPEDPDRFAGNFGTEARMVGSFTVAETSGWGPLLVFKRDVPGALEDDASVQRFFSGNRALEQVSVEVNLAHVEPLVEERAWALLKSSGEVDAQRGHAMRSLLEELSPKEVERFVARLERWAQQLDSDVVCAAAGSGLIRGSDGFRAWRFGVIGEGREVFEACVGERSYSLPLELEEFGFALATMGERVIEDLTGARPVYSFDPAVTATAAKKNRRSTIEEQLRERDGDGTVDLHPGPRDVRSMHSRGLRPKTVVSRFFVRLPTGSVECLLAQHIDMYREDVARHVRAGAVAAARELGGVVCTSVEWYNTMKGTIQDPLTMFEIRRSWKGDLESYLAEYCLA